MRIKWALASLFAAQLVVSSASADTPVRFTLDWLPQAPQAIFMLAKEKGYFKQNGLDVTIQRGFGSSDAITKTASGQFDIGLADVSTLIKFNAENPARRLIAFYQYYDSTLTVVVGRKDRGINVPKDLEGKTLASPEGEGSRVLFPAFASANGVDASKVKWETVNPQLRESMLAKGNFDAIGGFTSTVLLNLEQLGVKPETITVMPYATFGLDLYGTALMTTPAYAEKNPEVLRGFVKAVVQATRDALANPAEAIAVLKKLDQLTNEAVEMKRFLIVRDNAFMTPDVKRNGFGGVTAEKMQTLIKTNSAAFNLTTPPRAEDLFTSAYLPPASARMP